MGDSLREVGYTVTTRPAVGVTATNAVWWGEGIELKDLQFIAYTLIQRGFDIRYLGRSERFNGQIQIGGRPESVKSSAWTPAKVRRLTRLPIDNEAQ